MIHISKLFIFICHILLFFLNFIRDFDVLVKFFLRSFKLVFKNLHRPLTLFTKIKFNLKKINSIYKYNYLKSDLNFLPEIKKKTLKNILIVLELENLNPINFINLFFNIHLSKKNNYKLCIHNKTESNFFQVFLIKTFFKKNLNFIDKKNSLDTFVKENLQSFDYILLFNNNFLLSNDIFYMKPFEKGLVYFDSCSFLLNNHFFKPIFLREYFYSFNYLGPNYLFSKSFINYIYRKFKKFDSASIYLYLLFYSRSNFKQIIKSQITIFHNTNFHYRNSKVDFNSLRLFNKEKKVLKNLIYFEHGNKYFFNSSNIIEPKISIIIPTRDAYDFIKKCISSIIETTTYNNYEIIIVDNGTVCPQTLAYFDFLNANKKIKILRYDISYNYSKLNNYGFKNSSGDYIVLLNNDTSIITPSWLNDLLNFCSDPSIGCVGPRLLYPDGLIQHTGTFVGIGVADHAFPKQSENQNLYNFRGNNIGNFSSITAACLMVSRFLYSKVGGFDEKNVKIAFSDVDFCLKVASLGKSNLITPYTKLYHYETATRSKDKYGKDYSRLVRESSYIQKKWKNYVSNDPCYNINLTRSKTNCSLRSINFDKYF